MKASQVIFVILFYMVCSFPVDFASVLVDRETANSSKLLSAIDPPNGIEDQSFPRHGNPNEPMNQIHTSTEEMQFSSEFPSCAKVSYVETSYVKYTDGSVYVPSQKKHYTRENYRKLKKGILVCDSKLPPPQEENTDYSITIFKGVNGIHITSLVIYIIVFLIFYELRNLPGYCLLFYCISELVSLACVYVSIIVTVDCTATSFIKAYTLLASFFWLNVMSYDIWWSLKLATRQLRLPENGSLKYSLVKYSAYAWGVPCCLIVSGVINFYIIPDKLEIQKNICWFQFNMAFWMHFVRPILVLFGVNIFLFVSAYPTIRSICKINSTTVSTTEYKAVLLRRYLATLFLALVVGFIWIFEFLAYSEIMGVFLVRYLLPSLLVLHVIIILFGFTLTPGILKTCQSTVRGFRTTHTSTAHDLLSIKQSTPV